MTLATAWAYLDIEDPLVAWMAYRGQLVSASEAHEHALSLWLSRLLARSRHGARDLRTELAIESARQAAYPEAVSRVRGFYVFPDQDGAAEARRWGGFFTPDNLVELAILEGSKFSRHDPGWWSDAPGGWMARYLSGDAAGPQPTWELVVEGRAWILGTEVRERARTVIERTWPKSLAVLELARIGCWLDSDLGVIVPMLFETESGVSIKYVMNFADAEDPHFLERFARLKQENPEAVNHAALQQAGEHGLVVPDLRAKEVHLP